MVITLGFWFGVYFLQTCFAVGLTCVKIVTIWPTIKGLKIVLSKSLVQKLTQRIDLPLIFPASGNLATELIQAAYANLKLNSTSADTVGCWLSAESPSLPGVVQDETPSRKNRTVLSNRASDFDGINQRFSGGNTSTGKTALSAFAWVRPTTLSGSKTIIGESVESGNDRGWLIYFDGSNLRVIVSADGDTTNAKNYVTTSSFTVSEWIHVGFVFGSGALTLYVDGKAAAVTQTTNGTVATINDSAQAIELASTNGGANYLTGQLQQPLIWESALTAAEVRDLYLQQYDDITAPDYGWFLDGDSAYGLTSASPALTPSNSPDLYESEAVPVDWLNEKGWNRVTKFDGDLITITDGLEVDFSKDVKIKMSVNYTTLLNSMELFEFAPNKNARTHFTTRLLWVLTGTGDVTTTGGDPTFTSDVWYDLEFDFVASSGTMTISVNDVVKATLAGQSPAAIQTLNNIGGGSTPLTALVSGFEVYGDNVKIFRLDGLVDSVGGLPLTVGAGISELNYPKRWDEELDSAWQPAANSESFGVARRDGQLVGSSNCISLDGINQYGTLPTAVSNYLDIGNAYTVSLQFEPSDTSTVQILVSNGITASNRFSMQVHDDGTVRTAAYDGIFYPKSGGSVSVGVASQLVCSWDGSSVFRAWLDGLELGGANAPTTDQSGGLAIGRRPSAAQNHLNGKVWDFRVYDSAITSLDDLDSLSAVTEIPMAETTGDISYDVSGNGKDCTWVNSPTWGNQSSYFWNENKGCSLYEHATSPDILVPFGSDGSALTITSPSGYTKTSDNPAGPYLKGAAKLDLKPVSNSSSASPIYYTAEGDGVGYLTLENQIDLTGAFDIEFLLTTSDSTGTIISKSSFGSVSKIALINPNVFVRVVSSSDTTVSQPSSGVEHSYKLSRDSSGVVTLTIDGTTSTLFGGVAQVGTMELQELFASNGNSILSGKLRNLKIIDDGTTVLDMPLYKDSLDRSPNCNHGTISVAGVSFLSETPSSTLEPPITNTNTMTANTDRQIVQVGQR